MVTPCVGVWIETKPMKKRIRNKMVTPCVGVWIETPTRREEGWSRKSHPAWVCGLKLAFAFGIAAEIESHPAWVCGLKLG